MNRLLEVPDPSSQAQSLPFAFPGIYADFANTKNVIVNTNFANVQLVQATGFTAALAATPGIHAP